MNSMVQINGYSFPLIYLFLGITGVVLVLFLIGSIAARLGRRKIAPGTDPDEGILARAALAEPSDWAGQMDRSFSKLFAYTGSKLTPAQATAIIILVGSAAATITYFLTDSELAAAGAFFIGLVVPLVVFISFRNRWQQVLNEQLPDAMFLMARSLRTGLNLEQSTSRVGELGPPPINVEFRKAADQIELGLPPQTAFQQIADRSGLPDIDSLAATIALHRRIGGNLPSLLDQLGTSLRDRIQFRGYLQSATALSRLTAGTLAIAAPIIALIYAFAQPTIFRNLYTTNLGYSFLTAAIILEIVGVIWIVWLIRRIQY
jgi:tight adherence protein B